MDRYTMKYSPNASWGFKQDGLSDWIATDEDTGAIGGSGGATDLVLYI